MDKQERGHAIAKMTEAADAFYRAAVFTRVHPFVEFAGLMNEYIRACQTAHEAGIDFTACSKHSGMALPLHPTMSDYINEKLECIFSGSKVLEMKVNEVTA